MLHGISSLGDGIRLSRGLLPIDRLGMLMHRSSIGTAFRAAVLLVLAILSAACRSSPPSPPSAPVDPGLATIVVIPAEVVREQSWDGVVEAVNHTSIAAQTNARVLALPFDIGDRVEKGDVLVRFTDVEQRSGRSAAAAHVEAARATYRDAEANWQRVEDIVRRGLMARAELDGASARRDAARGNLDAAEAALRSAGQQTDYTEVRAPFAGVITQRFVQVGEAVQSGPPAPQPLIALAALDELRVQVVVPQGTADAIRRRHDATVLLDDGRRIRASETIVFPHADPETHSFRVRVVLPAGTTGLYPGMTVKTVFTVGHGSQLLVPATALVRRGEIAGVYVIGADHSVSLRQIRLGHGQGNRIEVLAGLAPGETIALDPDAALSHLAARRASGNPAP